MKQLQRFCDEVQRQISLQKQTKQGGCLVASAIARMIATRTSQDRIHIVKKGLDNVHGFTMDYLAEETPDGPVWVEQGTSIQELGLEIYEIMLASIPQNPSDAEGFMLDLLWDLEVNYCFPGMYNE